MGLLDIFEEEIPDVIYPLETPSIFLHIGIMLATIEIPKTMIEFSHFINSSKSISTQISSIIMRLTSLIKMPALKLNNK